MSRKMSQVEEIVPQTDEIDESLLTTAPDDWEFETVVDESPVRIIFDTEGDTFIGQFEGRKTITPDNGDDPFDIFVFRGRDERLYSVNTSTKLDGVLTNETEGKWVKLELIKLIPSKKGQPFKDFRISVRK